MDLAKAEETKLPKHQMFAGTYDISKDKISIMLGDTAQEYHIVNDGIAKWKYIKKK